VGVSPTRQPLQPEATGAVMEVTKCFEVLRAAEGGESCGPFPDSRTEKNGENLCNGGPANQP
jgi:hypothetical protein